MTQEVATRESTGLSFSRDKFDLLKATIAKDHTDDELKLFLAYCQARGLDPFGREVYSVKRSGKVTFQMGIDGLRGKADETGEYDAQETFWCGPDGRWADVWLKPEPPVAAKVFAYRLGRTKPFVGIAKWEEYKPAENDFMWKKMPANQLAKCAEALALRKAFPRKLGGLYATEEMAQASRQSPITAPQAADKEPFDHAPEEMLETQAALDAQVPPPPAAQSMVRTGKLSPKQQAYLFGLAKQKGWDEEDVKALTGKLYNKADPTSMTTVELNKILTQLHGRPDASSDQR